MKLSGAYKYFKIAQLIKAMFVPLLLFTQTDYKSLEHKCAVVNFIDISGKIINVQKAQEQSDLNNFRIHGFKVE